VRDSEFYPEPPPESGITKEEWERLPLRTRMLIIAGFVDVDEAMEGWHAHWIKQDGGEY